MNKISKRIAAIVTGGVLAIGGFAFAEFTMSSTGDATGVTATPQNPTVNGTIHGVLWPGDCNDVSVTFANPNDHAVKITDVSGVIKTVLAGQTDNGHGNDGHNSGNDQRNLLKWQGVTTGNFAALNHVVGPKGSYTFVIPNAVCLSPDADNSVEGKDIAATITVNSTVVAGNEYHN